MSLHFNELLDHSLNDYAEAIIKTLKINVGYRNLQEVFCDWVDLMAFSVGYANTAEEYDNTFVPIVESYSKEQIDNFFKATMLLKTGLKESLLDILGTVYMMIHESSKRKSKLGQFFSPSAVSQLLAKITFKDVLEQDPCFITDPTCGSGSLILGAAKELHKNGKDFSKVLRVEAFDLDEICVKICFVQMEMLHIPAMVIHGDVLAQTVYSVHQTLANRINANFDRTTLSAIDESDQH